MYAIIQWLRTEDKYITFIHNENGSTKIFRTVEDVDRYANEIDPDCEKMRVISLDGVEE